MNSAKHGFNEDKGKVNLGCIFAIFLMAAAIFLSFKLAPPYLSHYEFKGELKQAISRAGARTVPDEAIIRDLMGIAEKNNISLKKENIKLRRLSNRVSISIEYTIPVDFLIMKRDLHFQTEESSFAM